MTARRAARTGRASLSPPAAPVEWVALAMTTEPTLMGPVVVVVVWRSMAKPNRTRCHSAEGHRQAMAWFRRQGE